MEFHYTAYRSPLGEIHLLASSKGLRALGMRQSYPDFWQENQRIAKGEWVHVKSEKDPILSQAVDALDAYFKKGRSLPTNFPLDLQGTLFQVKVWKALLKIPFGKTYSYGQVAAKVGKPSAARAVGGACRCNPVALFVPCHRVIAGDGNLTGFGGGGVEIKRKLLTLEGAAGR
jgi:methylated-DNA-[protein]-cysteine S-methyltransferase